MANDKIIFFRLFTKREKPDNKEASGNSIQSTLPSPIAKDLVENPTEVSRTVPTKYTVTMKLTGGLSKDSVGPPIRQTLLTPSADQLTRRSSTRSVRR
ncbi:unnamed protein product [Echinostoma caproni]|uniref:Uncharacterized protein n=1 Tax=Echinostoma caproni TaxID=27848 RepID=A0A183A191_9TREM|nr:unnamed protein product [Echinostoma caproni]